MTSLSKKTKKVLEIIATTLECVVIVFLLIFSLFSATTSSGNDLLGKQTYAVRTDSMETAISTGDLIFCDTLSSEEKNNLKVGQIIVFRMYNDPNAVLETHRIIEVLNEGTVMVSYRTQGDNVDQPDDWQVAPSSIVAVYSGFKLPGLGAMITFANDGNNFIFIVIIPLALLFIWNGYYFLKLIMNTNKEKALVEASSLKEQEKEALLEEAKRLALEELKKEQEKQAKEASNDEEEQEEEPEEEVVEETIETEEEVVEEPEVEVVEEVVEEKPAPKKAAAKKPAAKKPAAKKATTASKSAPKKAAPKKKTTKSTKE